MKNFVLVHGAWHGAWCWRRVDEPLRRAGHSVHAPTLTGLADRSHLLSREISLETHIHDVANLLRWHDLDRVVLCGHSYGGMIVTAVADRMPERVRAIVYVDAGIPEDGQRAIDTLTPARRQELLDGIRDAGQGWFAPPTPAKRMGVTDPRDIEWIDARCTPHPARTLTEPIHLTGAQRSIPRRIYILASANVGSAYHAIHARLRQDPGWETHAISSGHEMMITHPDHLAEILLEA